MMYSCLAGVVASRAQWRFRIFAVGLQMAIKLKQVKLNIVVQRSGAVASRTFDLMLVVRL